MPKEFRKRGRKKKKDEKNQPPSSVDERQVGREVESPTLRTPDRTSLDAPFGYVDSDVKAYFQTLDLQIRSWQEIKEEDKDENASANGERHLFLAAALTEMSGKEKQLATDAECSIILERAIYSMDDFVKRVFMDTLTGSYEILARHRFASHVCQTLFSAVEHTIFRESRGIFLSVPESSERGELRTITQLVHDVTEELLPAFTSLITDPFASHVARALLVLLSPDISSSRSNATTRSRKSALWKAKQGSMKSVFGGSDSKEEKKEKADFTLHPLAFQQLSRRLVEVVRDKLTENEVRALAVNKVASPCLQLLLEIEADLRMSDDPNSLMDRIMVGMISACKNNPGSAVEASDYVNALLHDPTSSHLFEVIVSRSPNNVFCCLWTTYFGGKLPRLAVHSVANFVLAKALERVSPTQFSDVCTELGGLWGRIISSSRTGVLRALIERSSTLRASEREICEAVYSAFGLVTPGDRALLVPCALHLLPLEEYKSMLLVKSSVPPLVIPTKQHQQRNTQENQTELKIQGSFLLQSLLQLHEPHNEIVISSLMSLPMEEKIKITRNASGSRVYDAVLESSTVALKAKRELAMAFIGHYHLLVDDRLGSRVCDTFWAFADTYLKEKIARSLLIHEQFLASSYYGKFFARKLNLRLLQRRPDEWKTLQASHKRSHEPSSPVSYLVTETFTTSTSQNPVKRKQEGEIDVVFNVSLGNNIKKRRHS